MTKPSLRVVFDTNTFQPGNFDVLADSPLESLCRARKVVPVYGHVFLEEMWRAYGSERKRVHLVERWIPFIATTVDRFCEDFLTIWHRELVQGRGRTANVFMRPRLQRNVLSNLARVTADGSWDAWHATQDQLAREDAKRNAQREVSKAIRQEVADWKKSVGYTAEKHGGPLPLRTFVKNELLESGKGFIRALVACPDPNAVANRWARDPGAYPYFTAFVRNMVYMGYYAATRTNSKIDVNAQGDLDLMTHLLRADVIVSNESGFLKSAFTDIWRPAGKVLMTSEEFGALARKLGD